MKLKKIWIISAILFLYILISSAITNATTNTIIQTNERTDQATSITVLKETAKSNQQEIKKTNNIESLYISTFDVENSLRRALFTDTKLSWMKVSYNSTNFIYFYQWKNMYAYYITLPFQLSFADYLGLSFNIQEFIRVMLLSYDIESLKSIYVKEFLTLTLASGLLTARHLIIDKYEFTLLQLNNFIKEIESVKKICDELDKKGVDYHTTFNNQTLKMLVAVKEWYKKEGNIFYPSFKVWDTSLEEVEKYHKDLQSIYNTNK